MDLENTIVIYITDKSGGEMFKNYVHKDYLKYAKIDLQNHLKAAKKDPKHYHFLDVETAEIKHYKIN